MKSDKDIKLLILVATEEEKKILISEHLYNDPQIEIIVTGIGSNNVIKAIREYAHEVPVYNIGLSAGTPRVPTNELLTVPAVMPGFNYGDFQTPIKLGYLNKLLAFPCVSAPGFITDVNQFFPHCCYSPDYLVDMELYTIASYFDTTFAFKVVSDAGNFDDYLSTLEDYDIMEPIREKFKTLVNEHLFAKRYEDYLKSQRED